MIAFKRGNCIVFCPKEDAKTRGKFLLKKGRSKGPSLVPGLRPCRRIGVTFHKLLPWWLRQ